uniref:Uncharacterized protein n=1 Tax=Oryza brachyantha TaxID=4533 RepID=J3KWT2_ORYBR
MFSFSFSYIRLRMEQAIMHGSTYLKHGEYAFMCYKLEHTKVILFSLHTSTNGTDKSALCRIRIYVYCILLATHHHTKIKDQVRINLLTILRAEQRMISRLRHVNTHTHTRSKPDHTYIHLSRHHGSTKQSDHPKT